MRSPVGLIIVSGWLAAGAYDIGTYSPVLAYSLQILLSNIESRSSFLRNLSNLADKYLLISTFHQHYSANLICHLLKARNLLVIVSYEKYKRKLAVAIIQFISNQISET
jgi:hypothetical protein